MYIFLPCAIEGCAYFQKSFCLCQAQRQWQRSENKPSKNINTRFSKSRSVHSTILEPEIG